MTDHFSGLLVYRIQRFEVGIWSAYVIISESTDRLLNLL